MRTVGVRELKDRLSEYLRRVKAGESVLVTARGEVVAEISPPGERVADPAVPPKLAAMARQGLVRLGAGPDRSVYHELPRPARGRASAAEMLEAERGSR